MTKPSPRRGEVWFIDFGATRGREQAGRRPGLVISADDYNRSPSGLVVVLPITRTLPRVPWHVSLQAGEGGLQEAGAILCDHVRSISLDRLSELAGEVAYPVLEEVQRLLQFLLGV